MVPELAAISGLSRAAFARAFRDALGQTPMQYVTDWPMVARDHLRNGQLSMTGIARTVGYRSSCAFAAAFRRHHGEPPGAWRHQESHRALERAGNTLHTHDTGLVEGVELGEALGRWRAGFTVSQ